MSAPSRGPSPYAERGVAVIMAMLTVALVAALAASVVAAYGFAVENVSGRHDLAEARWLARGAVDWARNVLADDKRRTRQDHFGEPWAIKIPPTPVDEGEVGGEIEELSGRFNINDLAPNGTADPQAQQAFERLLTLTDVPQQKAKELALVATAWVDFDQETPKGLNSDLSKAPNAPLVTIDELLDAPGFDASLIERLRPLVTAVSAGSKLNLNTVSAEVMCAWFPTLSLDGARAIIAARGTAYYLDVTGFNTVTGLQAPANRFDVQSRFFLVVGRARFGSATTRMQVLLDRNSNWPDIVWQRIL